MNTVHLGLSVNASCLTLACAQSPGDSVDAITFKKLPKSKDQDLEILDNATIDKLEEEILDIQKQFKKRVSRIYFCIPAERVKKIEGVSLRMLHPKHSVAVSVTDIKKSLEQARLLSVDWSYKCLHSLPYEYDLDGKIFKVAPLGIYGKRLTVKVLFYACSQDYLSSIDRLFQRLGKDYTKLIASPLAYAASLNQSKLQEAHFALCNLGRNGLELSCFKNFILEDIKVFSPAGKFIDEEVSRYLNVPLELAEDIKISYGSLSQEDLEDERSVTVKRASSYRDIKRCDLNSILLSSYKEILGKIKKYLEEEDLIRKIDFIVPLGGVAEIKGFSTIAESVLSLPVKNVASFLSIQDEEKEYLSSYGALRFILSKFNIERSYRFPSSLLRRLRNVVEEFF